MTWITIALISTAILGVVNVIDSYFIARRMPSLQSFLVPTGFLHLIFALVIMGVEPMPSGIGAAPILVAVASGIARSLGIYIMLRTMRSEEVSRIIPVTNTYPIFVAIFAVPLLDEVLGLREWLAICMTVAGAVLISTRWDSKGGGAHLRKSFVSLMTASLLMGVANTTGKHALDDISFWNMYSINAFCFCAVFLILSLRPRVLNEIRVLSKRNITLTLIAIMEIGALVGIVMSFWAIERGPVSLVSAVLGIRPAIVFLFAMVLTRTVPSMLEERITRGVVITKTVSIALIILGVTIINF